MKPLILIEVWFGPWPKWIEFHLETCRWNPEVDWLIFTDQLPPENRPPNVKFEQLALRDFTAQVAGATDLDLSGVGAPYKLCDLRPAFGRTFEAELAPYSHYGYADLDVFFGDIRRFYTDEHLAKFDVLSTSEELLAGHLAVFRNTERMRQSFRHISGWRKRAVDPIHFGLDEHPYRRVFRSRNPILAALQQQIWKSSFVDQMAGIKMTPTEEWAWSRGRLTSARLGDRDMLYAHFMRWQSSTRRKSPAPWPALGDSLVQMRWQDAAQVGFVASPNGIRAGHAGRQKEGMTS